ncbi:MAG: GNAT family N-acetyltransferase [Mariniphaga sp.]
MYLIEINNTKSRKLFHRVPHIIYKNDPNWICPLEGMTESIFDPRTNPSFKNGDAIRWVLFDEKNLPIGRIAAFYNHDKAKIYEQPTGGCGFFECIDQQNAAGVLFDAARDWLKAKGMEAMDGPINFGENYMNWGLLADGFMPQGFGMPYHPPYYLKLFENYGFQIYFKQFSYHLDTTLPELPERFWKVAEWVSKKPDFSFKHFTWKEKDKFLGDFARVYDNAWRFHKHFRPIDQDDLKAFIISAKSLIEEDFIWFAYHKDEPIALFVMVPDFNQILAKLKGRITPWNLPKVMWLRWRKTMTRTRSLIIGIVPKYQRSGIEAAMFWHLRPAMYKKRWYREMELSWAGDFNPKIVALYESVGGKRMKTHYTMRYLFDRQKPFVRAPIISAESGKENS